MLAQPHAGHIDISMCCLVITILITLCLPKQGIFMTNTVQSWCGGKEAGQIISGVLQLLLAGR